LIVYSTVSGLCDVTSALASRSVLSFVVWSSWTMNALGHGCDHGTQPESCLLH